MVAAKIYMIFILHIQYKCICWVWVVETSCAFLSSQINLISLVNLTFIAVVYIDSLELMCGVSRLLKPNKCQHNINLTIIFFYLKKI